MMNPISLPTELAVILKACAASLEVRNCLLKEELFCVEDSRALLNV